MTVASSPCWGAGMASTTTAGVHRRPVPRVVTVLALCVFVLGTSEFVLTGLLSEVAADLGVDIPAAGYLISGFAVGMVVGAPAAAVATLRLPRRTTLVAMLLAVAVLHVVGALCTDYPLLMAVRVLTAVATGGFWAVAVLALLGVAGVGALVPRGGGGEPPRRLSAELVAFRRLRLWVALGTTALYQAGMIAMLAYLAALLVFVAGLAPGWVPVVQFGAGLGSIGGILLGGRLADRHPWPTLFGALCGAATLLALLGTTATLPGAAPAIAVGLGFVAFVAAAPLNARVFALAGAAPTLASATNTSAFNVGNALGPALGGLAIAGGLGLTAPPLVGAALVAGAVVLALVSVRLDRRHGAP